MAKWSMGVALLTCGLVMLPGARAQYLPPAPMPEPLPVQPPAAPANPIPTMATPGMPPSLPPDDVHLGEDSSNAFEKPHGPAPCSPTNEISLEYLLWKIKRADVPPLLTLGTLSDPVPGALGEPGTFPVVSGNIGQGVFSGFRLAYLYAFDTEQTSCVEANFFLLEQRSAISAFSSNGADGSPVYSRPFFNPNSLREDADPVSVSDVQAGSAVITLSDRLLGAELNWRFDPGSTPFSSSRLIYLVGLRYLGLDEKLDVTSATVDLPVGAGNHTLIEDTFTTFNHLYAGQVGADLQFQWGTVSLDLVGKLAAGYNMEVSRIRGATVLRQFDGSVVSAGNEGLLAQPSNVGRYTNDEFSFAPEVSVNLGWQVSDKVHLFLGYQFLWWDGMLRPGDQIDRVVNVQPLNGGILFGPARPAPQVRSTDFYVQGLNLGLGISF